MSQIELIWNNPPMNNESFKVYIQRTGIRSQAAIKYAALFYGAVKTDGDDPKFVYKYGEIDVDKIGCDIILKFEIKKWLEIEKEIMKTPPKLEIVREYCIRLNNCNLRCNNSKVVEKLLIKHHDAMTIKNMIHPKPILQYNDYNVPASWIFGPS